MLSLIWAIFHILIVVLQAFIYDAYSGLYEYGILCIWVEAAKFIGLELCLDWLQLELLGADVKLKTHRIYCETTRA